MSEVKRAFADTYGDVARNHTMQMAAALVYQFGQVIVVDKTA